MFSLSSFSWSLTRSLLPITNCLCLRMSIVCLAMSMFLCFVSSFGFHWQDLSFLLLTVNVYECLWFAWLCLCFYVLYLVSVIIARISPSYYQLSMSMNVYGLPGYVYIIVYVSMLCIQFQLSLAGSIFPNTNS